MKKSVSAIKEAVKEFDEKYGEALHISSDPHLFDAFCSKIFFFDNPETPFDADDFADCIVDGAKDGGVDVLFANPSDSKEMIVVQGKYYDETHLALQDFRDILNQITETVRDLRASHDTHYNTRLKKAFAEAESELDESYEVRVLFCTTEDFTETKKNSFRKICEKKSGISDGIIFEIRFKEDIIKQLELCDRNSPYVAIGELTLDKANNALQYGKDAVVVNVSAASLNKLYKRHGKKVLGMNLRYHLGKQKAQKEVDANISETIEENPHEFWYLNNGIVVICDKFRVVGNKISFDNFSIINGGQTSYMIGNSDFAGKEPFYLLCKVIAREGKMNSKEHEAFCKRVATATNSQKPIKESDLKANNLEQHKLKNALKKCGVCYVVKAGDTPDGQFSSHNIVNLEKVGLMAIAGMMIRPSTARSKGKELIFQDEIYRAVFDEENQRPQYIADMCSAIYAYGKFKKFAFSEEGAEQGFGGNCITPMIKQGEKHFLACVALLAKWHSKTLKYSVFQRQKTKMKSTNTWHTWGI